MKTTTRTIQYLRKLGLRCQTVEKYNQFSHKYNDLFGIIDIICLQERGIVGIQACGTDFQEHVRKITIEKSAETREWLSTPGTFLEIWGWRKVQKVKGGKQKIWKPRIKEITLEML